MCAVDEIARPAYGLSTKQQHPAGNSLWLTVRLSHSTAQSRMAIGSECGTRRGATRMHVVTGVLGLSADSASVQCCHLNIHMS